MNYLESELLKISKIQESTYVDIPPLGTDHYFFPEGEGYRDWEKNVCMRKNAEINCLPQRCIW